jgi:hypothetical protein
MAPAIPYSYSMLPTVWPGKQRPDGFRRIKGPFKVTTWSRIERELSRELAHLGAKDVVIALDMPKPQSWNMQGAPRADARAQSPAAIVSFTRRDGNRLTFPCDTYADWQTNIYAIAMSLEKLRAVDRYGVTQGDQQYVGFRALPPGGSTSTPAMTEDEAAQLLGEFSDLPAHVILAEPSVARVAIRAAKGRSHPDADGEPGDFERVTAAAILILRLHGDGETAYA